MRTEASRAATFQGGLVADFARRHMAVVNLTPRAMRQLLARLRYVFLGLFALGAAATWSYQIFWVEPGRKCESAHRWWDPGTRTCAIPVSISTFTHRPTPGETPR